MIYFTADEHYGHENIIKYCNRPFSNVNEMDEKIISNHNEIVKDKDIVYHLGDFTLKSKEKAITYISRLNGIHKFINGSHDYWNTELPYIIEKEIGNIYIVLCHYAMRTWARSYHGSIQLYGHSHGKLLPKGKQLDVGVDVNNFYPISFKQVKKILKL